MILPLQLKSEQLVMRPSANCINTIRRLNGESTVLMVNHSDRSDPTSVFALSASAGEPFYYLSARELFDMNGGIRGKFMQGCGAYSVRRGHPEDLESKEMTISLIAEGKHKLIMFPEGDVTGRDDEILPLKEDGLKNIFAAQRIKLAAENPKPVYLLPIAIYYEAQDDAILALQNKLALMERKLELVAQDYALESRIDRVLRAVVSHLESYYGLETLDYASLHNRIYALCRQATLQIANHAGLKVDENDSANVLVYSTRSALAHLAPIEHYYGCNYCDRLEGEKIRKVNPSIKELDRLQQLLIIASTMQEKYFSLDLAWRLVDRLEQEVLGSSDAKGHRIVWMEAAEPIPLIDYYNEYQSNPALAIQKVDQHVRKSLVSALVRLKRIAEVVHTAW